MKNIYSGFESLNNILDKVVQNLGIDRGLKQITLINFWPQIIGKRYQNKTKAVAISKKGSFDILVIAVESAALANELSLYKKDILEKLKPISQSLDLNITDVFFSFKIWGELSKKEKKHQKSITESYLKNPSDKQLEDIEIPESLVKQVKDSVKSQKFSDIQLKDRMIKTILRDLKVQIWKKNNGYPFCEVCGIPLNYRSIEGSNLCPACKYN